VHPCRQNHSRDGSSSRHSSSHQKTYQHVATGGALSCCMLLARSINCAGLACSLTLPCSGCQATPRVTRLQNRRCVSHSAASMLNVHEPDRCVFQPMHGIATRQANHQYAVDLGSHCGTCKPIHSC
jgi:hypothetical protein